MSRSRSRRAMGRELEGVIFATRLSSMVYSTDERAWRARITHAACCPVACSADHGRSQPGVCKGGRNNASPRR